MNGVATQRREGREISVPPASRRCMCAVKSSLSPLQKGQVTAEAQRSQRKMLHRVAQTHASPHIHFMFDVLCALGVSAVRFCSEVMIRL